jgi:uncharacterized protein involved in exopolysaccharide biosynthesis
MVSLINTHKIAQLFDKEGGVSMDQSPMVSVLTEMASIVFKHGRLFLITFFATLGSIVVWTLLVPPTFESEATILVKFGREYVYVPAVTDEKDPVNYLNREGIINNEIEILSSQDLFETTITRMGVDLIYPDLASNPPRGQPLVKVAEKLFRKNLSIKGGKDMDILKVSFRHPDPLIAAKTVNLLIELYREKHLLMFGDKAATAFLDVKVNEYAGELAIADDVLKGFRSQHAVFAIDEQRTILLRQQGELKSQLHDAENQLAGLRGRLKILAGESAHTEREAKIRTETGSTSNDIIDKAKEQLLTLHLKEREYARTLNEHNRLLTSVRHEIDLVQDFMDEEKKNPKSLVIVGSNEIFQDLQKNLILTRAEIETQTARVITLERQLGVVTDQLAAMLVSERELHDLEREVSVKQENYRAYRNKLEALRLSDQMDLGQVSNLSVIQPASAPIKPIRPIMALNMALGFLMGLLAGLVMAMFKEFVSEQLTTPGSVENRLGLPVLAIIDFES